MRISVWSSDVCSSALALDLDAGDASVRVVLTDVLAKLEVLVEPLRVVLVFVPLGVPGLDDPESEPIRMRLLTHGYLRSRDRQSVVLGKSVLVRVALGGRRIIKTKKQL